MQSFQEVEVSALFEFCFSFPFLMKYCVKIWKYVEGGCVLYILGM